MSGFRPVNVITKGPGIVFFVLVGPFLASNMLTTIKHIGGCRGNYWLGKTGRRSVSLITEVVLKAEIYWKNMFCRMGIGNWVTMIVIIHPAEWIVHFKVCYSKLEIFGPFSNAIPKSAQAAKVDVSCDGSRSSSRKN